MKIPFFNRHETRAANTYTEAIVAQLIDSANAETIPSGTTAAEEIVVGLFGRAFASAKVTPDGPVADALTPRVLAMMGRDLAEYGESVWEIEVDQGGLMLAHASDYTVEGMREWVYTLDHAYPDGILSRTLPADRVVHLRYGEHGSQPWKGIGPLRQASTTRRLTSNLESRLADESSARSGYLLPVPQVSDSLQADLNKLKGKTVLVESVEDFSGGQASKKVMEPVRLGFTPPQALEVLRLGVNRSLLVAAGVPAAMLGGDANEMREGYRQFLHGTILPVSKLVLSELREKLDTPTLTMAFDDLMASDIAGRARGFGSLVTGGMNIERAAALSGLLAAE